LGHTGSSFWWCRARCAACLRVCRPVKARQRRLALALTGRRTIKQHARIDNRFVPESPLFYPCRAVIAVSPQTTGPSGAAGHSFLAHLRATPAGICPGQGRAASAETIENPWRGLGHAGTLDVAHDTRRRARVSAGRSRYAQHLAEGSDRLRQLKHPRTMRRFRGFCPGRQVCRYV
jgi:hypothetical protein